MNSAVYFLRFVSPIFVLLSFNISLLAPAPILGAQDTAGQAGRATNNVLTGQEITQGLGNPNDMIADAALGGAFAGVGYGVSKGISYIAEANRLANSTFNKATELINSTSASERGPVLTGVMDRQTGKIYFGLNQKTIPENLSSILSERVGDAPSYLKTYGPGTHSEIYALNEAIQARGGINNASELSQFMLHNRTLRGPHMLKITPRCPQCRFITNGVQVIGGE